MYFVNLEVWVEAENALGRAESAHLNFDPVDRGGRAPESEGSWKCAGVRIKQLSACNERRNSICL